MTRPTYRVHLSTHHDRRITGRLIPSTPTLADPPTGYGDSEEAVLSQIALALEEHSGELDNLLWREELALRRLEVEINPSSVVDKRIVIGKQRIPLRIGYAWAELPRGGYKIVVPPLGWMFVLEDLEMAADVLRRAIATALLGEQAGVVYGLHDVVAERVIPWWPTLARKTGEAREADKRAATPVLDAVAEDWIERERRRTGRRLVGQFDFSAELPMIQRERPRSLLLVGPAGVGKTAWVRALARLLGKRQGSDSHVPRIWASSADRIVAGMSYLGMWEQRCLDLVEEMSGEGDLLYFERLGPILAAQTGRSSIADLLMPAVLSGELSLLSECTPDEHERLVQRAPTLLAAFHIVPIDPPPPSAMPNLLATWQSRAYPKLTIDGAGWRRLVQHLEFFQRDLAFPGKAFRFLDALNKLKHSDEAKEPIELDAEQVSASFAEATGLPLELISDSRHAGREHIAAQLARGVVGQAEACSSAARVLTRLKAGLNDPDRPIGSLFFVGPTGVGKTELAKQLARYMFGKADTMVRIDMSEYMLPGSAQRLLASGSGVRSLIERVRERPLSLVLFDEIEKAHPEVFDLLLGVLGEGRLTDTDGRLVDFRMTLVVMTSNIGVATQGKSGFGAGTSRDVELLAAVRAHFRPEFFNRIDHVIPFRALSHDDIGKIVELELAQVSERVGLQRRRLRLRVDAAARDALARAGWHPTRGARPLKRVIEERVIAPLAVAMAEDPGLTDRDVFVVLQGSARPPGATVIEVADGA
ncbi:MAG TPA: AAA family ATPase [Nannocystaceae bacterium]|nr:AAA family ATPase [Nannocystaceae bacterium]